MSFCDLHNVHQGLIILTYNNKNEKSVIICHFEIHIGRLMILTYSNKSQKSVIICHFVICIVCIRRASNFDI